MQDTQKEHKTNLVGILLVDKPQGITSHDVVYKIRKLTGVKKVGHAGTLDPLATGLLIVLVGRQATKLSDSLRGKSKTYTITMELGRETDTLDSDGSTVKKLSPNDDSLLSLSHEDITQKILSLVGTYSQQVPMYSAVKIDGKKLYQVARSSSASKTQVTPPSRNVTIHSITDLKFSKNADGYPEITFTANVSSGTYTRSLVRDIGKKISIPTNQTALRRTSIEKFDIAQAKTLEAISVNDLMPLGTVKV